jgi:uncharacterized membrane protein YkvA (DUF1232 family)
VSSWWQYALFALLGVALLYALSLAALLIARPRGVDLREAARLVPDVARLVSRLARDRRVAVGLRVRLWLLLGYLLSPIDLVPDMLPVIGWADDVIIVLLVLRTVVRRSGPDVLARHWVGTPAGLAALSRMCGGARA